MDTKAGCTGDRIVDERAFFTDHISMGALLFKREALKVFVLFIVCFYGLYILVDFSSHSTAFHHQVEFRWRELAAYYLSDFIKRVEVIIPFAIMIATIKTLCGLNIHNELVALMASGIKLKTLLKPFVLIGLFFVLLVYLNTEVLLPKALKNIKMIDAYAQGKKTKPNYFPLCSM